jgi:hypothetical protein
MQSCPIPSNDGSNIQNKQQQHFHENAVPLNILPLFPKCLNINFHKYALQKQAETYGLEKTVFTLMYKSFWVVTRRHSW